MREGAAAVATLRPHAATPPKAHPLTPTTTPMSPRHAAFLLLLVHAVCLHYPRKTHTAYRHMAKTIIIRKAARRGERYLFSLLRLCHILRTLIGSAKYRTIATIHKAAATYIQIFDNSLTTRQPLTNSPFISRELYICMTFPICQPAGRPAVAALRPGLATPLEDAVLCLICPSTNPDHHPNMPQSPPTTLKLHWDAVTPPPSPPLARPAPPAYPPCADNRPILSQAIIMIIVLSSLQSAGSRTRSLRPPTTLYCWGSCHHLRSALGFAKHRSASSPCRGFAFGCRPSYGSGKGFPHLVSAMITRRYAHYIHPAGATYASAARRRCPPGARMVFFSQ